MKHIKKLPSCRRQALRRVALVLALVLVVNHWSGTMYLLPRQYIRRIEERYGLCDTTVICRRRLEGLEYADLLYLTAEKQALMLASTAFVFPVGWIGGGTRVLDCSTGERLYGGYSYSREEGAETYHIFCFGKLGSWDIKSLNIYIAYHDAAQTRREVTWTVTDFIEKDDSRYFLAEIVPENPGLFPSCIRRMTVTACNIHGEPIAEKTLIARKD